MLGVRNFGQLSQIPHPVPPARQITDATGTPQKTVGEWVGDFGQLSIFAHPPSRTDAQPWGSIQHFDVWSFASN